MTIKNLTLLTILVLFFGCCLFVAACSDDDQSQGVNIGGPSNGNDDDGNGDTDDTGDPFTYTPIAKLIHQ